MAVLITGGTGKTSSRLWPMLQDAKIPFLILTRKGEAAAPSGMHAAKFDWLDSSTFKNPFQHESLVNKKVSAIYLVAPEVQDPVPSMKEFVDLAINEYGVKRFVLLAGDSAEKGGYHVGQLWQHLDDVGVDYTVLKPTWFNENLSEGLDAKTIKAEGKIYSACGDGKIPFVSVRDISAVVLHALTNEKPLKTEYRVTGPELLSFGQAAAKISNALGRKIEYVKLSQEESAKQYMKHGLPEYYANFMAFLETTTAEGVGAGVDGTVEQVTGRPAQTFDDWVQENKNAWS